MHGSNFFAAFFLLPAAAAVAEDEPGVDGGASSRASCDPKVRRSSLAGVVRVMRWASSAAFFLGVPRKLLEACSRFDFMAYTATLER